MGRKSRAALSRISNFQKEMGQKPPTAELEDHGGPATGEGKLSSGEPFFTP